MKEENAKKPVFSFDSVVIDCKDADSLAEFYAKMLGWRRCPAGNGWAAISNPNGTMYLYFQTEPNYEPPVWPAKPGYQQMMIHLDFDVDDLDAAVAHAISCGARLADTQYLDNVRVCIDPEGHPFCICKH